MGPTITSDSDASHISIRSHDQGGPFTFGDHVTWRLTLPQTPRLALDVQLNAGSATIGLASATLDGFDLQMNAGSSTVDLGSVVALGSIDIELNAGSLGRDTPTRVDDRHDPGERRRGQAVRRRGPALRLHTGESIVASYDYAGHGLVQDGSTWTTPGFDSGGDQDRAGHAANAGSFVLDPRTDGVTDDAGKAMMSDRLYRSRDDRMIAGVAGGVAEQLDADPSLIRIVWAVLIVLTGGLALLVYIVMADRRAGATARAGARTPDGTIRARARRIVARPGRIDGTARCRAAAGRSDW